MTSSGSAMEIGCPACGHRQRLTTAVGQRLSCPSCGTVFYAPVLDADAPGGKAAHRDAVDRAASGDAVAADGGANETAGPADGSGSWAHYWLYLAVAMAAGAVLGLALVIFFTRQARFSRAPSPAQRPEEGPAEAQGILKEREHHLWPDATSAQLRLGGVVVQVQQVRYDRLRAKDQRGRVIDSGNERFLLIFLSIRNQNTGPAEYRSWYGRSFGEQGRSALLTDSHGRVLPMQVFEDVRSVEGHTDTAVLQPRQRIFDTLVFSPPEGLSVADLGDLYLEFAGRSNRCLGLLPLPHPRSDDRGS